MKKYVLYGAGNRCKKLLEILKGTELEIASITDSNDELWGKDFEGYTIERPINIKEKPSAIICITVWNLENVSEIRKNLRECGFYNKEISYNQLILEAYRKNNMIKQLLQSNFVNINQGTNILFDAYSGLRLGGVESWTFDICNALIEQGKEATYILTKKGNYDIDANIVQHVLMSDIDLYNKFSVENITQLINIIISKLPCKVVTCTVDDIMLAAYLIKCQYPELIQIISVIHNSNENVYREYNDFKECADVFVGVSSDIIKNMEKIGVEKERLLLSFLPFRCPSELFRKYSESDDEPIHIGYAGRIEIGQKRMDLLLKIISILHQKKIDFRFEIAGDGTYLQNMKEYIRSNHLGQYVKFDGYIKRSQISDFWKRQDICVNIADFEGRSISIIEAMGNGAVPVVTEVSGTRDDIVNGVNGYLVNIGDYQSIADKIVYLSRNRGCLRTMGKLAHDSVYPKSLMKPHVEFWVRLLEGIKCERGCE